MVANPTGTIILLLFASTGISAQAPPKFMGRKVTIIHPKREGGEGGVFSPKGPAAVCVEGQPRQCYTAPKEYGNDPKVEVVQLKQDMAAILFSAATGGVSGWEIHFALLRAGAGKDLEDSFMSEVELSNQSQHAFWRDSSISNALIFVTADYAWGPSESHYSPHRYFISTYVLQSSELLDEPHYYLEDRYMTAQRYDLEGKADVLGSEKQEILARLKRVRQKPPTPR